MKRRVIPVSPKRRSHARAVGVFVLLGLALPAVARANDSEAVVEGGVLTLKKSDGIEMESEELVIRPLRVEVSYLFRNTTAADITTRVAFPMAPYSFPGNDSDSEDALEEGRKTSWHDFGRFKITVDGKPVAFQSTGDVDKWTVTVTHHWLQTFPAGKTISVKHSFQADGSFIFDVAHVKEHEVQLSHDYCVGPVLMRALKKGGEGVVHQVHYILRTGANWKGPIGHFVLRLEKETPSQKVSLCVDGFKKVDARTFVLEKTNFVPTQDLKIAFID